MKSVVAFVCAVLLLCFVGESCALGPKVEKHIAVWDANTESDLAGYYLYWRAPNGSYNDTNRVQIGVSANPSFDLLTLNLPPGRYVIAVSAFDTEGNESGLSNEVTWDADYPSAPKNTKVQ